MSRQGPRRPASPPLEQPTAQQRRQQRQRGPWPRGFNGPRQIDTSDEEDFDAALQSTSDEDGVVTIGLSEDEGGFDTSVEDIATSAVRDAIGIAVGMFTDPHWDDPPTPEPLSEEQMEQLIAAN